MHAWSPPPKGTKTLTFMTRPPGHAHERFMAYWVNQHAPLCRQVPGMNGMVANEAIGSDPGDRLGDLPPIAFDGIAESYKPDWGGKPPPQMGQWTSDAPGNVGCATLHNVHETVVKLPHRGDNGLMVLMARRADLTHEAFIAAWAAHAEKAKAIPEITGLVLNEVFGPTFSRVDPGEVVGLGENDLILQIWREPPGAGVGAFTSSEAKAWMAEGLALTSRNRGVLTREYVMIYPCGPEWTLGVWPD
jgi:hypothetical protein